jgi:hypothetical protein
MPGLGEVDLALSFAYSALLVVLVVVSYLSIWRRRNAPDRGSNRESSVHPYTSVHRRGGETGETRRT